MQCTVRTINYSVFCILYLSGIYTASSDFQETGNVCNNTRTNCTHQERKIQVKHEDEFLRNWISTLSGLLVKDIGIDDLSKVSSQCLYHLGEIRDGLLDMKKWAFQFLDAFGKVRAAIGNGRRILLGDFDKCVSLNVDGTLRGKSCIMEFSPTMPQIERIAYVIEVFFKSRNVSFPQLPIGDVYIDEWTKPDNKKKALTLEACIPSSCTERDAEFIVDRVMGVMEIEAGFKVVQCQLKEEFKVKGWDEFTAVLLFAALTFLVACATVTDIVRVLAEKQSQSSSGLHVRILLCFSLYTNTRNLLEENKSEDSIKIFNGMKVVSILWIILCHTYWLAPTELLSKPHFKTDVENEILFYPILNAYLAVDTFFFISGCLVVYSWMKIESEHLPVHIYIIRRIMRLTPPLMLVIAFQLLVFKSGSSSMWKIIFGRLVSNCKERWWTNMLFINNFWNANDTCMVWSSYVACDMQLYIIALAVVLNIKRRPLIAFSTLFAFSVIGVAAIAFNQVYYQLPPYWSKGDTPAGADGDYYTTYEFYRMHMHALVYFIGMAVGYLLHIRPKIKISTKLNILLWIISFVTAFGYPYLGFIWHLNNVKSPVVSAVHGFIGKAVWSLALGWVTISCCNGTGGIVTTILSWSGFTPLARTTYLAYLTHPIIQIAYYASSNVPIQSDHRTAIYLYLGVVLGTYLVSYTLNLLSEAPFLALDKIMFRNRTDLVENTTEGSQQIQLDNAEKSPGGRDFEKCIERL